MHGNSNDKYLNCDIEKSFEGVFLAMNDEPQVVTPFSTGVL